MAIYLFSQILKFTKYSIKPIEKLSRRHLINSSDVFVIKGFTVCKIPKVTNRKTFLTIISVVLSKFNAHDKVNSFKVFFV